MQMSLEQFKKQLERSKSYIVTELFISTVPSELYINNSMNIPASAERNLRNACIGRFATEKDENDYITLMELIKQKKPIYPLNPVIRPRDVVGLTLENSEYQWTLSMRELRAFAAGEIFGVIETPYIKINANTGDCIKSVYVYTERGGKVTSIYQQSTGTQNIPAVSASYINILEDGAMRKIRIEGTLTIPILRIPPKYRRFID